MNFTIPKECITDVRYHKEWGMYDHIPHDKLTPEQLIKILKGEDRCSTYGSSEHPEFEKLRDTLELEGYIKTERSWSNGDRVLKKFTLNGVEFVTGDTFYCAAALRHMMEYARKNRQGKMRYT